MSRWPLSFALLALLLPTLALAAMPAPYTARYEVLRNGERMGQATVALKALGNGRAEFSSITIGSEGLAALTAATIEERSVLRWHQGAPETVSWDYRQKVAWKTRERSLEVDPAGRRIELRWHEGAPETVSWDYRQKVAWKTRERSLEVDPAGRRIELRDKDKQWSPPYQPGVLDRNAVTVALMQDLAAGHEGELRYLVPDKDELETWVFRVGASERIQTALGAQRVLRVERIRESANGRSTTLWLAQDRAFVPLRILQKEPSGDTIDMRILSLR